MLLSPAAGLVTLLVGVASTAYGISRADPDRHAPALTEFLGLLLMVTGVRPILTKFINPDASVIGLLATVLATFCIPLGVYYALRPFDESRERPLAR